MWVCPLQSGRRFLLELGYVGNLVFDFQPAELWEINLCCLSHPVNGTFLYQPKLKQNHRYSWLLPSTAWLLRFVWGCCFQYLIPFIAELDPIVHTYHNWLAIRQLTDIWFVSRFWLLWINLLRRLEYESSCDYFYFSWVIKK